MSSRMPLARNTVMLYFRMLISVCVNLYASRVILSVLGVEDFGVYNIVAGVVAMLGFLNTSMSGCTSRFLTYELGRGDENKLRKTFNSAVQVHIFIALIVLVLGETVGLWFINHQLVIPETRVIAANVVYQLSLISALITFLQVPFSADVIAHERMDAYAYIEITNVLLKLFVVLLLSYIPFDKLVGYSIFLTLTTLVVFAIYWGFCKKKFKEIHFNIQVERESLLPMIKFTGWDLYGNSCVLIQQQGINVLINRFFGVVLNAATGVATQASSAVSMFVSSFTMAIRPSLIKKYASGDIVGLQKLLTVSIILCLFLTELISVPLYLRLEYLMSLWLTDVPLHAVSFCKWLLLANSVSVINTLFTTVIHATGNIKRLSLIGGSLFLSTVVFSYFAFKSSCGPTTAYMICFFIYCGVLLSNIIISKIQIPDISYLRVLKDIGLPLLAVIITVISTLFLNALLPNTFWGVILLFVINALIATCSFFLFWFGPNYGWNLKKNFKKK